MLRRATTRLFGIGHQVAAKLLTLLACPKSECEITAANCGTWGLQNAVRVALGELNPDKHPTAADIDALRHSLAAQRSD